MIDFTQDYTELLQYQNLLDTNNPTEAGGTPWVEECLSKVGWKKGDPIPGGMSDYIAAILNHLQLKKTSKNVKDVFNIDEVKMSVQNAIRSVYEVKHADEVAKEKAKELMGNDVDFDNPLMKKLYDAAVRVNEKALKAEKPVESTVVSSETATQLLANDAKTSKTDNITVSNNNTNVCPRCGFDITAPLNLPKITDEERRNYLMHVIGGARFFKSYALWGGVATVVFQTPTIEEEAVFDEYYNRFVDKYRTDLNFQRLLKHYQVCRSALLFKELKVGNKVVAATPGIMSTAFNPKDDKLRLQLYIETWYNNIISSKEMMDAICIALDSYLHDIGELQQSLYSQDFWKGEILN